MDPKGVLRGQPYPLHFIKCVISRKPFRSPPINHIFLSLAFSDMDLRTPRWVHAPPPSFHKMLNILETVQIPTYKPYIFLFLMMRRVKWHGPWIPKESPGCMPHPLHFIKRVISRKLFRSSPINHIYLVVPYDKLHLVTWPTRSFHKMHNILETVQIPTHKPYIFLFWLSMALWQVKHFNLVSKISQKLFKPLSWNLTCW